MPADPSYDTPLAAAARRRHELTRSKAIRTLRELDDAGAAVTFDAVAKHADVSRSWLYTQPDLRAEIQRLRETNRRTPTQSIPATQRASDDSLLLRLQQTNQRNHQLVQENKRLRRQLEHALGEQRATRDQPLTPGAPSQFRNNPSG